MTESYKKKTVLITGGSRGIGAATVKEFAKNGYNVIINCKQSIEEANNLKNELEELYNVNVLVLQADISKEEDVKKLLEESLKEFETIDVLINNAGIAIDSTLEDKTVENFKKTLDTNLIGVFLMCKYFGTHMKNNQGFGSIVNISSTNGIDSYYPYSMDYDASKAGVISLNHNFAIELSPKIRVNCVAPGWVNTEMNKELDDDYIREECEHILLARFAEPEEIAKTIFFVAEETYMNDSIIKIRMK